jgi:hypothetical protein
MVTRLVLTLSLVLGCGASSAPGAPTVADPGFDVWCGDKLCNWQVDRGMIARVPTWHRSDYGVALLTGDTAISQAVPATSVVTKCMRVNLVSDADEVAGLTLEMDFLDDGSVEYETRLPASQWASQDIRVSPPTWYVNVRFRLRTTGPGHAVLAQLAVTLPEAGACPGTPVPLDHRPAGATCENASQCASGACTMGLCQ